MGQAATKDGGCLQGINCRPVGQRAARALGRLGVVTLGVEGLGEQRQKVVAAK